MSSIYFECIQCGSTFEFSDSENRNYVAKGFDFPQRCPECRKHKDRNIAKYKKHPNRKRDYRLKYGRERVG